MNQMRTKNSRRYVFAYYEGEGSEKAYLDFIRTRFRDVVIVAKKKGFFPETDNDLDKVGSELNKKWDNLDEIWFFFDIDPGTLMDGTQSSWKKFQSVINKIHSRSSKIKIRILMTTGCIEYWFLLHFEQTQPVMDGLPFKERMLNQLRKYVPQYTKSGAEVIQKFADSKMEDAIINGQRVMRSVERNIKLTKTNRDRQLYISGATFSNVYETLEVLKTLQTR